MKSEICMLAMAGDEKKLDEMIASENWHFEKKWDGERALLTHKEITGVTLLNRRGKNIISQFPELIEVGKALPYGIYDGEIYVPANEKYKDKPTTAGRTNVNERDALLLSQVKPAVFKCWDVIEIKGEYIVTKSYEERKIELMDIERLGVKGFDCVYPIGAGEQCMPDEYAEIIHNAWKEMLEKGDEGMVAKRAESRYTFSRSPDWLKLKTWQEADFKVVGFTSEKREISALILDGGLKVNCSMDAVEYDKLLTDLIRTEEIIRCQDGTIGTRIAKPYTAKIKFLSKTETGLRFPVLRELM